MNKPLWSAVIPTYGEKGVELTKACINSIKSTEKNEIVVVDDGSSPGVQDALAEICEDAGAKLVCRSENGGFAKATNEGILAASGRVVILQNNDTLSIKRSHDDIANFTIFTSGAVVGCKLLYGDNSIQHAGVHYVHAEPYGYMDHIGRFQPRYTNYACRIRRGLCTGAFLAVNRYAFDSIGLLDERYGMAWEDIDFQMRCIETNLNIYYCGIIEAYHLEGQTRGRTLQEKALHQSWTDAEERAREMFFDRWQGVNFTQFQLGE